MAIEFQGATPNDGDLARQLTTLQASPALALTASQVAATQALVSGAGITPLAMSMLQPLAVPIRGWQNSWSQSSATQTSTDAPWGKVQVNAGILTFTGRIARTGSATISEVMADLPNCYETTLNDGAGCTWYNNSFTAGVGAVGFISSANATYPNMTAGVSASTVGFVIL